MAYEPETEHAADTHAADAAAHGADAAAAHGGEHTAGFPPFDPTVFTSQLIWFAITFGILYWVVSRFVVPSVERVLEKRATTLAADREGAAAKTALAEQARATMERAAAKARADARKLVDDMRAEVQTKLGAEQAEAEARLAKQAEASAARIAAARTIAMAEIPSIAETLGRDIADRLAPAKG